MSLALRIALLSLASVLALAGPARAGEFSTVSEVRSDSEDAAKLVTRILEKEVAILERCGEGFDKNNPGETATVNLKITLSAAGGAIAPAKADDMERKEVGCLGKLLSGLNWPKANRKVLINVAIELGKQTAEE